MNGDRSRRQTLQFFGACAASGVLAAQAWGQTARASNSTGSPWRAWEVFRQQFVSPQGRVIDLGSARSQTFSEGQSYALFFALVANDRSSFEKLLRWTEDNLCEGDLSAHLPTWLWGQRDDNSWGVLDSNSASDADLWLAYALAQAGRLWNERRYRALSSLICARIVREETSVLPGLGASLLPGARGFNPMPNRWRLNPSYLPAQLLRWFALNEAPPIWRELASSSLKIVTGAAIKGYAPDWIIYDSQLGFLPDLDATEKGQGAYNAIRVYLWVGLLHPQTPERAQLLQTLAPMARYVREHGQPPESIDILSGVAERAGPSCFSAALLPFLEALGDRASLQLQRERLLARPPRPDEYYAQALTLFGQGWLEGFYRFDANGGLQPRWKTA